ncbi:MAG: TIGR04222 domain-containing membrane protein [Streptosporangiaceae bacterium]
MPLLFAVAALVVILAAGALEIGARRQSLRAPEGAADRVPDVYELAYLAGGPERNAVTVVEALARGNIISVDGKGRVALRESHGLAAADGSDGELVPTHPSLAAAVDVLAGHGGAMPLGRLAERMRHTSAMAGLAERLRRWHLLLPAGYRPPVWPRIVMLAGAGCGVAALAWSVTSAGTAASTVAGAVTGAVAAAAGAGGWWLSGRHPRIPVTDAGHDVLTSMYTHYRRGGMPDMAGHGVALRGADAVGDLQLREQLGALETAGTRGWVWRPAERPDQTVAETTSPARWSRFPIG